MATYDAPLNTEAFSRMEERRQTIFPLVAKGEFAMVCSGDRIEFGDYGSITAGMVRRYSNLEALIEAQGWQCILPDASDADDALLSIREEPTWDSKDEQSHGIIAVRVREAARKT